MLEFVLHNNNFKLIGDMYHQILGTAIETKCAFPRACLIIDYKGHFRQKKLILLKRYLKDAWMVVFYYDHLIQTLIIFGFFLITFTHQEHFFLKSRKN